MRKSQYIWNCDLLIQLCDVIIYVFSNFVWLKECCIMSGLMMFVYGYCDCFLLGFLGGRLLRVVMIYYFLDIKVKRKFQKGLSVVFIGMV